MISKSLLLSIIILSVLSDVACAGIKSQPEKSVYIARPQHDPSVEQIKWLEDEASLYEDRYQLSDVFKKAVDNKGVGADNLYGIRNFRMVLKGVMYRGGANNSYLVPPRPNQNPLPPVGLENLCKENFSKTIYLYTENFNTAAPVTKCTNFKNESSELQYEQKSAAVDEQALYVLGAVFQRIKGQLAGPVYTHCWNGWHASGFISAIALKQFCGWSADQAEQYWIANTDGHSVGYDSLRARLRNFTPLTEYNITEEEQKIICPQGP